MDKRGDGVRVAHPLFQAEGSGANPTSPLQFKIEKISFGDAKSLNRLWHSRLPRFGTGAIRNMPFGCYGAMFEGRWYAVAIWSNPVARLLPQRDWLELRRLAIAPDAPRNTASRMLAVMARLIRKDKPWVSRLISYQDTEVHTGGIYAAAGWTRTTLSNGGDWTRPNCNRNRPAVQSGAAKQRWELILHERETRTSTTGTSGEEADVPSRQLPRRETDAGKRDAPSHPSLWDTSTDGG